MSGRQRKIDERPDLAEMLQRGTEERECAVPGTGNPPPDRARLQILLAWLWVVAWAAIVWHFGTDSFSLSETSSVMARVVAWLFGEVDLPTRYKMYFLIRKTAHFIEYAILALLAFRAAWLTAPRARIATACWIALFFVATLAAADEIRQSFSRARTGSPWDVLIDVAGGCVALVGIVFLMRRMRTAKPAVGAT